MNQHYYLFIASSRNAPYWAAMETVKNEPFIKEIANRMFINVGRNTVMQNDVNKTIPTPKINTLYTKNRFSNIGVSRNLLCTQSLRPLEKKSGSRQ